MLWAPHTHSLAPIYPVIKCFSSVCTEGILHFVFSLLQKSALKITLLADFGIFHSCLYHPFTYTVASWPQLLELLLNVQLR